MFNIPQLKEIYKTEQILLILLTRLYFSKADKNEVELFISEHEIKWPLFYKIARAHQIRAFLYHVISSFKISIPSAFELHLKKDHHVNRRESLRMLIVAAKLIDEFKQRDIHIIPYKGPLFAQNYYQDVSLRESSDLDFLIAKKDISAVEDYFIEKNYIAKKTVTRKKLNFYQKISKDIVYKTPLEDENKSFSIEMHWRLMDKFSGDYPSYDFFFPHTENYKLSSFSINKLTSTYDFLALISNHFVKDLGTKFKYLIDVAALIQTNKNSLDIPIITKTAKEYHFNNRLLTGLDTVEKLLGIKLDAVTLIENDSNLKVALQFPLQKTFLSDKEFLNRSFDLQDNLSGKIRFAGRYIQYIFIRGYVDVTALNIPLSSMLLYMAKAPFKAVFGKSKN